MVNEGKYGDEWRACKRKQTKDELITGTLYALTLADSRQHAEAQIIRLSDWLHDNEPDVFWNEEGDAATVIIGLLEKYRAPQRPPMVEVDMSTVTTTCDNCGIMPHTIATINAVDILICDHCQNVRAR